MSRAIRRQEAKAPKDSGDQKRSTRGISPRPSSRNEVRGAKAPTPSKRRMRLKVPGFLEEIISELKKVTWPTREETAYLTTVVIIVAVAAGIVLGGVDVFFNWLIDRLLLQ
ncbi:MAG: preprotein translocase subunit SecE [Dehalococcoidia bacterium]